MWGIISSSIWVVFALYLYLYEIDPRVFILIFSVCIIKILTWRIRPDGSNSFSFPSGHAALSMFIAASTRIPLLFIWSFLVGISRLKLNKHHLSDVLCGFLLGYIYIKI